MEFGVRQEGGSSDREDVLVESSETFEEKRRAARRRLLVGGSLAPLILTFGPRQAVAAGQSVCASLGIGPDEDEVTASYFCRPR